MEIKITFKFDASDQFVSCVDKLKEASAAIVGSGILESLPEKGKGVTKAVVTQDGVTIDKRERIYPPESPAPSAEDAPVSAEAAAEAAGDDGGLTEEDIRAAMERARRRIEGEDYKSHTDSEEYKKYHRQLTATFKNIASLLGSEKPSALPVDKRAAFIEHCDALKVIDGEITNPEPF